MKVLLHLFALSGTLALAACGNSVGVSGAAPAPTATISAAPDAVTGGQTSTLTWSSTNATACTASGGWSGALAASGTQATAALAATTVYSLSCSGAGGTSPVANATVTVTAASSVPTVTLTANPTSVASGGTSSLTWTSTNATSCTPSATPANGGWTGTLGPSGTQATTAITANTVFSLTCTGTGGTSTPEMVTVAVNTSGLAAPTVTLTATPPSVTSGGASTLTWSSTNATACTAAGGWSGTLGPSGTQTTGALKVSTYYHLTCTGAGGSASAAVQVNVVPITTLAASPLIVAPGAASTLTWSSPNATGCTASGSWTGALANSGSKSTGPVNTNSNFTLVCTGPGGQSAPATVTVNVVPTGMLSANPTVVASGGTSTLTWSSANATACTASGGWTGALTPSGTQATAAITATTTYTLTCTGAGGTSTPVNASVAVATGSLTPTTAALTVSQTQQFTATLTGGGTPTWTVDGIANGNAAVGTVTPAGLYTAGTTAGVHTVVATSTATPPQAASATVAVTDLAGVYTFHNNLSRNGTNAQEYALTTANVNTNTFGKLATCTVDGAVYAQPLWVANMTIAGAKHNVVFVATEHDSVFAFDADASACTVLWQANLLDAAHGVTTGEIPIPGNLVGVGAGDISPEVGVTGTPVIDPSTNILYVVANSVDSATQSNFVERIHAINITTGAEIAGAPTVISGTYPGTGDGGTTVTFVPRQELQRAGLALVNGAVYVAFTAHEDASPWYGWMMSYQFVGGTLTQMSVLNVAPNKQKSGIWMSGGAPAVDSNNNLYVLTGNGLFNVGNPPGPGANDYGDSLIQITPALTISSYFVPSNEANDYASDDDFGAGGATLLADLPNGNIVTHAIIAGGKDGNVYVLNRDVLGGSGDLNNGTGSVSLQNFPLANGARLFATGAIWNTNYYIGGVGGPMQEYTMAITNGIPQFTPSSQSSHTYGFAGVTPSISASATQNGIVWSLDTKNYCTNQSHGCGSVLLYAHDATNAATELWDSTQVAADAAGNAVKFTVPTIANGRVYVGTRGNNAGGADNSTTRPGEVDIYGLKP